MKLTVFIQTFRSDDKWFKNLTRFSLYELERQTTNEMSFWLFPHVFRSERRFTRTQNDFNLLMGGSYASSRFRIVSRPTPQGRTRKRVDGFIALETETIVEASIETLITLTHLNYIFCFFSFQFDSYLRSLKIDQNNICLVTDGQLPLRQCLHPEAGAKEIPLPSYYWKFSDLKKEFVHSKSGDLSRALISINDVSKLPNMPALPQTPSSIADILNGESICVSL